MVGVLRVEVMQGVVTWKCGESYGGGSGGGS